MLLRIEGLSELRAAASKADDDIQATTRRAVSSAIAVGAVEMKTLVPFKTGALHDSVEHRMTGEAEGVVEATAQHAASVDDGSRPHVIAARNAPLLRFRGRNGQWVSKASVNHPGAKAQPFSAKTAAAVEDALLLATNAGVDRALSNF